MDLTERDHPGWTIADAERFGLTHLEIRCQCGRVMQYPWRLLPPLPPHVPVASLAGRLVCNACAARPVPADMLDLAEAKTNIRRHPMAAATLHGRLLGWERAACGLPQISLDFCVC